MRETPPTNSIDRSDRQGSVALVLVFALILIGAAVLSYLLDDATRSVFILWFLAVLAALGLLAMAVIALAVPGWHHQDSSKMIAAGALPAGAGGRNDSYLEIVRRREFRRASPLGMVSFGGMVAIQSLWAGPWLTRVSGRSPLEAATGLFWINAAMLLTFWTWGLLLPRLMARGITVDALVARVQPASFVVLAALLAWGPAAGAWGFVLLALYCVLSTPSAQVQPVLAMAYPPRLAGRALSAFNLVIFVGIFLVQWGIGLGADALAALGWSEADALRGALGVFGLLSAACWLYYVLAGRR